MTLENEYTRVFKYYRPCNKKDLLDKLYSIHNTESLTEIQLVLIKEIQRYCEENGRFPQEKDMSNKNGYVSRTQFFKIFNINKFTDIQQYIFPLDRASKFNDSYKQNKLLNKPKEYECVKCHKKKEFSKVYFAEHKNTKHGLKSICISCENEASIKRRYRKLGIVFDKKEDINPEQWWEYLYEGKIRYIPEFCFDLQNIIKIVRHVVLNRLNYNRRCICDVDKFNIEIFKEYKLFFLYKKFKNKFDFISTCFPEMEFKEHEFSKYHFTEINMSNVIEDWINNNSYTTEDILSYNFTIDNYSKIKGLRDAKFDSNLNMFTWYFNYNKILHPIRNDSITVKDFAKKPNGYWKDNVNLIEETRKYCIENGIERCLDNTEELKNWVKLHFNQEVLTSHISTLPRISLYEMLTLAFPNIKTKRTLFDWEWHQNKPYTLDFVKKMLREFIIHRMNMSDLRKEIPATLRYTIINELFPRLNKVIVNGHISSYYEWACLSFPEYKNDWKPENFQDIVAKDGTVLDSLEELKVYEYIKRNIIVNISAIRRNKGDKKYKFDVKDKFKYNYFIPDFVIEGTSNRKPIIIEYYGLYAENPKTQLLKSYKEKTIAKNSYYELLNEYDFIALYPEDLMDNFKGINNKLSPLINK